MDFLEDDPRPRFLLQSGAPSAVADEPDCLIKTSKLHAAACLSSAALLLFSAFYFFLSYQTLSFLLVWVALSLLAAPFAPLSLTGGDITVGRGELIEEAPSDPDPASEEAEETTRRGSRRRSRQPRSDAPPPLADQRPIATAGPAVAEKAERRNGSSIHASGASGGRGGAEEKHVVEEKEWTEEDFEILKKQMLKHPVGTTRRWELISEAFGGRHGVESVIRTAKSALDRRHKTADSFQQFLRQRKPLDQRVEGVDGESVTPSGVSVENGDSKGNAANETSSWTSVEDLALLNALKAFPKDVSMRWEKIAAAVPGKSKACCMKRVTELKRDFRSSKASEA